MTEDIRDLIKRKTLQRVRVEQVDKETISVSGEFGVKSGLWITLEIKENVKFPFAAPFLGSGCDVYEERIQYNKITKELERFWNSQKRKKFSEVEVVIKSRGGNSIKLNQLTIEQIKRLHEARELFVMQNRFLTVDQENKYSGVFQARFNAYCHRSEN
jgi:hypothetical protein